MKNLSAAFLKALKKRFHPAAPPAGKYRVLGWVNLISAITCLASGAVMFFSGMSTYLSILLLGLVCFVGWLLNQTGHFKISAAVLIASLLTVVQYNILQGYGIHDVGIISWPAIIFFVGLYFGSRAMPYITAFVMFLAVLTRVLPNANNFIGFADTGELLVMMLIIASFSLIGVSVIRSNEQSNLDLRESEERYRQLYEDSTVGFYRTTPDGRFLLANSAMVRMMGFSSFEEFAARNLEQEGYASGYERASFIEMIEKAGYVKNLESAWTRKDGTTIFIRESARVTRDAQGKTLYFDGVVEDITEQKLTKDARFTAEANYRTIFEDATVGIFQSTPEGRFQRVNQAMARIYGYDSPEDMVRSVTSISAQIYVDPAARLDFQRQLAEFGEITDYFGENYRKDGSIIWTVTRARVIKDKDGRILYYEGFISDITERKQRENELQAIASLSAGLRTAPTRAEMLPAIVEQLSRLLNCDSISIQIIDQPAQEAVVEAAFGEWTATIGFRQPEGTGLNEILRSTRQPYLNNQIDADSRLVVPSNVSREVIRAAAGVPLVAQDQLIGYLWMGGRKVITEPEVHLLGSVADIAANAIHRATLHERTQEYAADLTHAYNTTLEGWAHALELRDQETEGHARNVVKLTVDLARAMGIAEADLEHVRRGALLHDIGKMGIPDSVLLKPGTLNEREWEIMRRHPEYACQLLEPIEYLRPALNIPCSHHEKWDGSGYPRGLKGEAIPLEARIFAVVDVWDALRSDRPYRRAWAPDKARQYIRDQSGRHFDPQVVEEFLEMLDREQPFADR